MFIRHRSKSDFSCLLTGMFFLSMGIFVLASIAAADPASRSEDEQFAPRIDPSLRAELITQDTTFHIEKAAVSNSGDRWALVVAKGSSPYMEREPECYEIVVWDPSTNSKTTLQTIKGDAVNAPPYIYNPVWSPDDKQVALSTLPCGWRVRNDEIDPNTGVMSEAAKKKRTEFYNARGSDVTVFTVETGESFSVHFPVEIREMAWGVQRYLVGLGYPMKEFHTSCSQELWVIDLSQEKIEPRYVFSPPDDETGSMVYTMSLLRGHDREGFVYFTINAGRVKLRMGKYQQVGASEGRRWTIYRAQVNGSEMTRQPVASWEAGEEEDLLIWPRTISSDGSWVACEAESPLLKGIGLALFSVQEQKATLIPGEKRAQPIGWSADGSLLYALIPDTVNPRPDGMMPRFAARYSFESLFE